MLRNWLYWIPVQYIVFAYVPETSQISVLTGAGLVWTVLLSILAGAATSPSPTTTKVLARTENTPLLETKRIGINPNTNTVLTTPTLYNSIQFKENEDDDMELSTENESVRSFESVSSSRGRRRQSILSPAEESSY
jgi:hypothetical protein